MNNTHTSTCITPETWQQQLGNAFSDFTTLCEYLELPFSQLPISTAAARTFPLRVPISFAACMEKGNPEDPLLRQVLPVNEEMTDYPGFMEDPVGDLDAATEAGVIHKYHGRVLFITSGSCAINCRYCFRRNFPYADYQLSRQKEDNAIHYIKARPEINEVILSGGDPLLLNDNRLAVLLNKLSMIPHLMRIRIHSRLPIVLPARITAQLLDILSQLPQQIILVLHTNHSNEISQSVISACSMLRRHPITLLNQSVLLKGVNDDSRQLCLLSNKLFSAGIMPYYLHMLDKATGTGHFAVPLFRAQQIMREVQTKLPGYLVPRLVEEQAGALAKTLIPLSG